MPIVINSHTVAGYLDWLGADYKRVSETVTLLGMRVNSTFYRAAIPLEIRTSTQWVTFRALIVNNLSGHEASAVALHVGYLNSQCRGVRYSMLEGSVLLTNEVHVSRLSKETFGEALSAMITFAIDTTLGLRVLATNLHLAELYIDLDSFASDNDQSHKLAPDDILVRFDLRPTGLENLLKREVTKEDDTERE